MRPESIARLIIVYRLGVVIKYPPGVLGAAGLVDEPTDLVALTLPEPADPAMVAVLVPEMGVDVPAAIEGRYELVTMMPGACRKLLGPRQIQANALERMGQRHGRASDHI
jgi:hypothetical protein